MYNKSSIGKVVINSCILDIKIRNMNLTNITTIMKVSLLRATHEVIIGFVCIVKGSFPRWW